MQTTIESLKLDTKIIEKYKTLDSPITFVADSDTIGDGYTPSTMECYQKIQLPQISLVVEILKQNDIKFELVDWQDTSVDWSRKRKLILGPIWSYTQKIDLFLSWLKTIQNHGIDLINSTEFVEWNIRKTYLIDLKNHGIPVPNTVIFTPENPVSFSFAYKQFKNQYNQSDVVIKGVVGAAGLEYHHVDPSNLELATSKFDDLMKNSSGVVMQSFIPEIMQKGELSFVFFNGKLSHSFIKVPRYKEEKVQVFYGGKSFHYTPSLLSHQLEEIIKSFRNDFTLSSKEVESSFDQVLDVYKKMLEVLKQRNIKEPTYLRIDGMMIDSHFVVMEIEGIEPYMEIEEAMQLPRNDNILESYINAIL